MDHDECLYLPPGFRFHPTDEEIVTHYLLEKIADQNFSSFAVAEANFNDCEPWDLPRKANMGEKEWFFFCKKDRKYPTGMRTNRATESGYWKATGKDREIYRGVGVLVGMKKTLVFYMGRAPRGQKSNWVMHEYRLEGEHQQPNSISRSQQHEWVVCKVYLKLKYTNTGPTTQKISETSFVAGFFAENPSLIPPHMDSPFFNSDNREEEETRGLQMDELSQPIFFPQAHHFQAPFSFNGMEEMMRGQVRLEQSSNSVACASQAADLGSADRKAEASSAVSLHQINFPSGLQCLDFDSIMKYEFV